MAVGPAVPFYVILATADNSQSIQLKLEPRQIGGEEDGPLALRKVLIEALKSNMTPEIEVDVLGTKTKLLLQQIVFPPPGLEKPR